MEMLGIRKIISENKNQEDMGPTVYLMQ